MEPNIPEWNSVIGWVGLLRPDSIWKILQVNAAVSGVYSALHYDSTKTKKAYSLLLLCWIKGFVVLCPSDLFSRYLFEELTMLRCYQLCPGNSSPSPEGTDWRKTPLLTQCLESQNNIQTFPTNKSIFLPLRKTIF